VTSLLRRGEKILGLLSQDFGVVTFNGDAQARKKKIRATKRGPGV